MSAPVGGKRLPGGQNKRWNDVVRDDLKKCGLPSNWRELAQERLSWRSTIKHRTEILNRQAEANEKHSKDEKKHRREQRLADSKNSLLCSHPSCSFRAHNTAGLANHVRQHHSTISRIPCPNCHQLFHQQGIQNHQRFCKAGHPPLVPVDKTNWPASPILWGFWSYAANGWMDGVCACACVCACPSN